MMNIKEYCEKLSRKNNSILYKLEEYCGCDLFSNESLKNIRKMILDVSADIQRLPKILGDKK